MSKVVDERVVEMRFDNSQFEKGVASTISTLDKFKQKLNFKGATKGLEDVGSAAQKVDMRGLGSGVETVTAKFSALQVMGVTALVNITNSALNAGKRIASALTLDPVISGFQEYETQMNAVQTILANTQSKGSTLDDVNKALDELNHYADLTIYNFTEMTRNIGTFTAAGIDLETSVSAIQGIANLAAVSGSSSQQASVAMYQLSQALAAGTVKLMDWNSVVNAGMGGEIFQNALKKTSELLGTGAEAAIKAEGSFRESLSTGWLTSQVLTETLKKFTTSGANEYVAEYTGLSVEAVESALKAAEAQYGEADAISHASKALAEKSGKNQKEIEDALQMAKTAQDAATKVKTFSQLWDVMKEAAQSGWSKTWQLIIGDFEEAKNLLTPLADFFTNVIGKMSDARNDLLESALGKTFSSVSESINKILTPAKKVSDTLKEVTSTVSDLGDLVDEVILGKFGNGQERINKLTEAGQNYYRIQNKVNETLGNSYRYSEEAIAAQDKLLGITSNSTDAAKEEGAATAELTDEKKNLIKQLVSMTEEQAKSKGFTDDQIKAFKELGDTADKLGMPLDELIDNLDQINGRWLLLNSFKNIGQGIITVFQSIGSAWKEVFPSTLEERSEKLFNAFAGFYKITRTFRDSIAENADEITRTFKGLFAAIDIVATIIGGPIKIAFKLINQLLSVFHLNIWDVTAAIGDSIVKFRDWLDSVLDFEGVFDKISPYLIAFVDNIKEIFESLKNSKFVDKIVKSFSKLLNIFKKLTKIDLSSISFEDVVKNIRDTLVSLPGQMKEIGRNIVDGLQNGIGDKIVDIISKAKELATKIIETVKEILGIHSPSTVMFEIGENIIAGLVNGIAFGIQTVINTVAKIGTGIFDFFKKLDFSPIVDSLKTGFSKVSKTLGSFDWKKLLAIIPIGVVLLVVKEMYEFVTAITDGIGSINNVIDGLAGIEKSISKVIDAKAFQVAADGLYKVAKSIAILAGAVLILSYVPADNLYRSVGIIVVLSIILTALAKAMAAMQSASAKIGKDGLKIAGLKTGLVTLGLALLLLAATVKLIGDMDTDQAIRGFTGLLVLVGVLAAFFAAYGLLVKGKAAQNMDKAGIMMLKMSASLLILVGVAKLISGVSWPDLGKAGVFITGFAAFAAAMIAVSKYSGKDVNKIGSMLIKMSIAMGLMVGVCKLVNLLTPEEMKKGAEFAAGFLVFVGLLVLVTKIGKQDQIAKIGGLLLSISVSLLLMVGVCKLVNQLSLEEIGKGALFLAGFMVFVWLLVKITTIGGDQKIAKVAATLLVMSVAVGILAGVAVLLSLLDPSALANGVVAVVLLGLVMAAMIAATKGAEKCVGNLIAMSIAVVVMAGAVAVLSTIDPEKLVGPTLAMTILMGMFAIILKIADQMSNVTWTVLAMAVAVGALGGVLYLLSGLPAESSLGASIALSVAMLAFAAAMRIISGMQGVSGMALVSIVVMALVVGALGGVLYLLQGLNPTQGIAIVGVIAAFVAVLLIALMAMQLIQAPAMLGLAALAIVTLVVGALAFVLYQLQDVDPTQAIAMVGVIVAFLAGMEVVCLAAALIGTLAGPAIIGLGILVAFIGVLGLVVIGLAELAMDVIAGMPKLGSDLAAFMTNVQPFVDGIQNIPDDISDKIGTLCGAILKLAGTEIIDAIAKFLSGGSSLADLGNELKTFGDGMAAFSSSMGSIDGAISALSKIKDLKDAIPDVDLSPLGGIAESLQSYSDKVSALNVSSIVISITIARRLSNLATELGSADFSGISNFNILPIGTKLAEYSFKASAVNAGAVSASIVAAKQIRDFITSLSGMEASGVAGFKSAVDQLATVSISGVLAEFNGGGAKLYHAGITLIDSVAKGMRSAQSGIIQSVKGIIQSIRNAFTGSTSIFISSGSMLATAFGRGLSSAKSQVTAGAKTMASGAASAAKTLWSDFYDAGGYLAEGFADGIDGSAFEARAAAVAMAKAALKAAEEALGIASPSKEAGKIGNYFGQGFANAIVGYSKVVYDRSSEMADSAKQGLSDAISKIRSIVENDVDAQPIIRPVVDLSNVESGVSKIGTLFDGNSSVGLKANINAIGSAVEQRRQNGSNSDVVSAIDKLNKKFDTINRPSYTIDGITYSGDSEVADAIQTLVRAAKIDRRV